MKLWWREKGYSGGREGGRKEGEGGRREREEGRGREEGGSDTNSQVTLYPLCSRGKHKTVRC